MTRSLLDIHAPRRKLFTLLGTPWLVTPYAWLNVVAFIVAGIIVALGLESGRPAARILLAGVGYGLLVYLTYVLHGIGHIVSAKIVGAPMDAHLITPLRQINLYEGDQSRYPKGVHIGRALGGPLANLLTGLAAWGIVWGQTGSLIPWKMLGESWMAFFSVASLLVGVAAFAPTPTIDGWVIWGELLGFRRRMR